ncbi:hypothetical protein [Nonomuraea sp. NPDC002799]
MSGIAGDQSASCGFPKVFRPSLSQVLARHRDQPAEETMRIEAVSKNNPADLNVALEKPVEAGLEILRYSTLDQMVSRVRLQVNTEILAGVRARMSEIEPPGPCRQLAEK